MFRIKGLCGFHAPSQSAPKPEEAKAGPAFAPEADWGNLPDDMWRKVFSSLAPNELARAGKVSHMWHTLTGDPGLWKKHIAALPPAALAAGTSLKAAYGRAKQVEKNVTAGRVTAIHKLRQSDFGHSDSKALGWSADGAMLAFLSDQRLHIVDARTGTQLARVSTGVESLEMCWSPQGTKIAVEQPPWKTTLIVDPLQKNKPVRIFHGDIAPQTRWSPSSELIAISHGDGAVRIHDPATGTERVRVDHGSRCAEIAWSPDGTKLLITALDDTARVTDVLTGHEIARIRIHADAACHASWSPAGDRLVCVTPEGGFAIVTLAGEVKTLGQGGHPAAGFLARWTQDGTKLAYSRQGIETSHRKVRIVSAADGVEIGHVFHDSNILDVSWSADGTKLASASIDAGPPSLQFPPVWVHLTDVEQNAEITRVAHRQTYVGMAFSPDSSKLAITEDTGAAVGMRVLDASTGTELTQLKGEGGMCYVSWSPDGSKVAYGGQIFDFAPAAPQQKRLARLSTQLARLCIKR